MSILIYFATIFWSLFPNLIHVFQGGDNFINKVNATNLVFNGNFSDGTTGWIQADTTGFSVNDNIASFIAIASQGRISNIGNLIGENTYYFVSRFKTDSNQVVLRSVVEGYHSGSGEYEIISIIYMPPIDVQIGRFIRDYRTENFTTIYVDYLYQYNVTEMIDKGVKNDNGISFSDLTDQEIKQQLDLWITEYGSLDFKVIYDNTSDQWFDTGFVEKTSERDFLDYLGYFVWLLTPPIILFATLDLLRRVI